MTQHLYTLLCDYVFQDTSGKLGLFGVFQNILLDRAPGSIARFFVVIGLEADPGRHLRILMANHDRTWESLVVEGPVPGPMPPEPSASVRIVGFIADVQGLEFPAIGRYQVLVLEDGNPIHSYPFIVTTKGDSDATTENS